MSQIGPTPLADAVIRARQAELRPLQIPGHKHRYWDSQADGPAAHLLAPLIRDDMPLQAGADDNYYTNDWLGQAERLYAAAIGADHTRFLVNGGTQGNLSLLLFLGGDDEVLAIDRTSHRSVLSGLILSGATPHWIYPDRHPEFGLPIGVPAGQLAAAKNASAVIVTSPSYVGTLTAVAPLAAEAHALGLLLAVDQAWGAHFDFNLPGLTSALRAGADLAVTSIHKALMGYTQTAIISARGGMIDPAKFNRVVDITTTTSPSGTLLASIDATRAIMEAEGERLFAQAVEAADQLRAALARVPGIVVLTAAELGCETDPLKVVLSLPKSGADGTKVAKQLWELGHGVESADRDTLIMTITVTDTWERLQEIAENVERVLRANLGEPRAGMPAEVWAVRPVTAMTPRAAAMSHRERVSLKSAVGRVSTEQFTPYPPGVPLIGPGEVVTEQVISAIEVAGRVGRVAYCSDKSLETIEVIAD